MYPIHNPKNGMNRPGKMYAHFHLIMGLYNLCGLKSSKEQLHGFLCMHTVAYILINEPQPHICGEYGIRNNYCYFCLIQLQKCD